VLYDDAAMRQMGLYTLTQSALVRLMVITMRSLFPRLLAMLRCWRRVKVIVVTTPVTHINVASQLCALNLHRNVSNTVLLISFYVVIFWDSIQIIFVCGDFCTTFI